MSEIEWCYVDTPDKSIAFKDDRGRVYGEFTLQPFCIAKHLVTHQQFGAFLETPNSAWWEGLTEAYQEQEVLAQRTPLDDHPRDTVSWYQAVAFTHWLTAKWSGTRLGDFVIGENAIIRLPTEWEWQWAAQGGDGRLYPWGNSWETAFANTRESRLGTTTSVESYPQGASWCGALDMGGNLWEWCLNEYKNVHHISEDGHNTRVLRGGSFVDVAEWAVCGSRFNDLPNRRLDYFGFRVMCGVNLHDSV